MRPELTKSMERPGLRFVKNLSIPSKIALVFVAVICLMAIFADVIAPYGPLEILKPRQAPSAEFWFGTDNSGRDIFTRILYGARYSLVIGLGATFLALIAALILGSIAATSNKVVSEGIMRVLDVIMSFPGIALAVAFVAVLGRSTTMIIVTIAFLYTPQLTRVVRANVLSQYGEDYVAAGKVMGASTVHILVKHVFRNCIAPILVFATVLVADAIVFEASLSFIQAGVPQPEPSWGNIISDGRNQVLSGVWWPTFFPGMAITLTVLALNILSEGLTDAIVAPAPAGPKIAESLEDAVADGEIDAHELAGSAAGWNTQEVVPLEARLSALREAELSRTDRLVLPASAADAAPLLQVKDLTIAFPAIHGDTNVVDRVSFEIRPGETMALVGESGCGKSITAKSIMGLLGKSTKLGGQVLYQGKDLLTCSQRELNGLRGHEMALIHQDALSALNPSMLIDAQFKQLTSRGGTRTAEDLLDLVGLDPARVLKSYAHELSGGQRQRVLIAMALTRDPKLLIADEPTTALDVTVEHQVIELLNELREKLGFAMLFVSHDLALVAEVSHKITVMYAGQMVEQAPTSELLCNPQHEYTKGLLGAVLSIEAGNGRLHQVMGTVPSPREFPKGDRFAPRSSRPHLADEPTLWRQIPGTEHFYAAHEGDPDPVIFTPVGGAQ